MSDRVSFCLIGKVSTSDVVNVNLVGVRSQSGSAGSQTHCVGVRDDLVTRVQTKRGLSGLVMEGEG